METTRRVLRDGLIFHLRRSVRRVQHRSLATWFRFVLEVMFTKRFHCRFHLASM